MSIRHLVAAAEYSHGPRTGEKLSPSTKLALMAHADDASDETDLSFPGIHKVMTWALVGQRRAQEIIAELVDEGLLEHVQRGFPGKRAVYRVHVFQPLTEDDPEPVQEPPEPVDNSQIMGAKSRAWGEMGAISSRKARDLAPLLLETPLKDSLSSVNDASTDARTAVVHDDEDSFPTQLGWRARRIQRRTSQHLDPDALHDLVADTFVNAGLDPAQLPRILYTIALLILAKPAKAGIRVTAPTSYVAAAITREPHVWIKRAFTLEVTS